MQNTLPDKPDIPAGIYRHYKGNLYEVQALARHSETEEWLVVYRALYREYGLWVRPAAMFTEKLEHQGHTVSRFTLIQAT
ncbi:DUF1653 domain-containing protein [Neisseria wadsworthii]|uniref:DUF1653 domain-containing protein n=1 Tax=Neisseria wadsworthii TaxID=607711 RepID=UPI000D301878|nr:DUF1653 domain-containing protein [Neisseria wadsworthii]